MRALIELQPSQSSDTRFDRWWHSEGEWVEPPNQRRGGESGVRRLVPRDTHRPVLYCKRQAGHIYRSVLHPFGRPTALREQQAIEAFRRIGIRVPNIVYCASRKNSGQWQAVLVTQALDGFISLQEWYGSARQEQHDNALNRQMLEQLASTLARLHLAGWQHGCCYPKHIFVKVSNSSVEAPVEVALLDLEKSRRRWRISAASQHDLRQLYRHKEEMPQEDWLLFHQTYLRSLGASLGERIA
ncbi:MAG: InaA protein [Pseudomonas sp.]|jgi:tRNA A-37 threonylcarbamoyl transferase component Bud32|uniref:InaA protein n=1 Tax=Stutzerimonas stutzeri TaxID=316 RepID=A0A6I6LS66_STUST|nr:lipopolysaccharide kinase InaA family protein [Stutzerimonas stutzeri]MAX89917.1 InaA protein [Pseudomonas sp.]QGZ29141.1 InaA protein [Stutzerimonas stutzeri]HBS80185.1 InaA protein [Pseudomonas sp.]HCO99877.1 InaA protein [Rhodospirillaceae bacterium]|tara:strand:- start:41707 stop:42432 length:726 start_codon:yes stop_codon:yes gene_type:complete